MSREIKRVATERVRVSEKRNTRNKTLWGFIEKASRGISLHIYLLGNLRARWGKGAEKLAQ